MINLILRIIILLLLVTFQFRVFSQNIQKKVEKYENWIEGEIVFKNGKTEKHMLNYNPLVPEGLLQVKDDGKLLTFSVKDVTRFSYFDTDQDKRRVFYTFPVKSEDIELVREYFFEIIFDNNYISLVSRPTMVFKKKENYRYGKPKLNLPKIKDYYYLVNMESGELTFCSKKNILAIVDSFDMKIKSYLKEKEIKLGKSNNHVKDYIKVIKYYSSLKDGQ